MCLPCRQFSATVYPLISCVSLLFLDSLILLISCLNQRLHMQPDGTCESRERGPSSGDGGEARDQCVSRPQLGSLPQARLWTADKCQLATLQPAALSCSTGGEACRCQVAASVPPLQESYPVCIEASLFKGSTACLVAGEDAGAALCGFGSGRWPGAESSSRSVQGLPAAIMRDAKHLC